MSETGGGWSPSRARQAQSARLSGRVWLTGGSYARVICEQRRGSRSWTSLTRLAAEQSLKVSTRLCISPPTPIRRPSGRISAAPTSTVPTQWPTRRASVGVRRLVLASSVQAVSAYPESRQRRAGDAARPANLYGATKAWTEALGAWVTATSHTSVVALRIGFFSELPPTEDQATPGNLSAWLSHEDCTRLIRAAVESDVHGLTVVNGISANRYRIAELGDNERRIGYQPTDDAWQRTPTDPPPTPS